jgi:SAM-dependent methyltransferase
MSQRLLARFPQAHSIAVDLDPILLLLGQQVLGDMHGRLRWVEADLSAPSWHSRIGAEHVDAVVSTTALHWLPAGSLVDLYGQLGDLVRPGGVFLNGDFFGIAPDLPSFTAVSESEHARWSAEAAQMGREDWEMWWEALRREPGMESLFVERERRFSNKTRPRSHSLVEVHLAALRNAGFHEVGVIWQYLDNRVVMAVC